MIKRLLAVALLALVAYPASAAMNIRQKGDGTAVWQGRVTGTHDNCVGGVNVNMPVTLSGSSESFVYAPVTVTNAVITGAWAVAQGTSAGTATIKIYTDETTNALGFYSTANTSLTEAQITLSTASAGTTGRISKISEVGGATGYISHTSIEGGYIAIGSQGGTTAGVTASVFIRVCPR